eukprot:TRINITY_DN37935_c0_g1_i1.p2 TRINITY_DN37935_c0_g1~~TRINITY_DN37935_c0_g1_i1.p2  ORF type:complete len:106 (+),score=1.66 TRINITY_DN37935_c0_g1_i1:173-490(+)
MCIRDRKQTLIFTHRVKIVSCGRERKSHNIPTVAIQLNAFCSSSAWVVVDINMIKDISCSNQFSSGETVTDLRCSPLQPLGKMPSVHHEMYIFPVAHFISPCTLR